MIEGLQDVLVEEGLEEFLRFPLFVPLEAVDLLNPRLGVSFPLATRDVGDEEDTSTGDGGRSGEIQVSDLENETHVLFKRNSLVGGESEDSVVVHDGVHRLDPVSIKITIENNPLGLLVGYTSDVTHH